MTWNEKIEMEDFVLSRFHGITDTMMSFDLAREREEGEEREKG